MYNVICDVCGFKFKNDQLIKRWDGLMVCEADYELRHPQDFIRQVHKDPYPLPYSRPRPADNELPLTVDCDLYDFAPVENVIYGSRTIYKGYVNGNLTIPDDVTVTVVCTLEIR